MNRNKSLSVSKLEQFSNQRRTILEKQENIPPGYILSQGDCSNAPIRKKSYTKLLNKLSVVKLNDFQIKPSRPRGTILNLRQQFLFPSNFGQTKPITVKPVEEFAHTVDVPDIQVYSSVSHTSLSNNMIKFHYNGYDEGSVMNKTCTKERKTVDTNGPSYLIQLPRPCSKSNKSHPTQLKAVHGIPLEPTSDNMDIIDIKQCESGQGSQVLNLSDIPSYLEQAIYSLQDSYWESNLQGLKILIEILHLVDWQEYEKYLSIIGRRLVDLIKSPRSMLVRITCQAAGELFRATRCFKRPEYEELVLLLLQKTGDPNKFIRKDANVALDKMVTFIPFCHSVRTLSLEGPNHKSALVRIATARLFVCVCALASLDLVLGTNSNARSRSRIMCALQAFLTDKNLETRQYGERLYKMLSKHKFFTDYFFKDMEMHTKQQFRKLFQIIDQKPL